MADQRHEVTSVAEKRGQGANARTRYRGRCSCGRATHLHYSTPLAARTALDRTHLADLRDKGVIA